MLRKSDGSVEEVRRLGGINICGWRAVDLRLFEGWALRYWDSKAQHTFSQNVPFGHLRMGPSILTSLAPAKIVVSNLPM